jgi:hypothetical protein
MKFLLIFSNNEAQQDLLHCITTQEDLGESLSQIKGAGIKISDGYCANKFNTDIYADIQALSYNKQVHKLQLTLRNNINGEQCFVELSCSYFDYSPGGCNY